MGIKDKVLDILFDDEGEQEPGFQGNIKRDKKTYNASSFLDTGSIFIDATSPLPKTNVNKKINQTELNNNARSSNDVGYQLTENISPIFGPIDSKSKKNKNISKIKSYNEISSKSFDTVNKTQTPTYTSVVISPIFGPISTKPVKRASKPRKKVVDPFDRDINDTGNFDTIINEIDDEPKAPEFEDVKDEVVELTDTVGDTDRLVRISDKINRIKNEAATIYDADDSSSDDTISEDGYKVETVEHENISDVIHSVQKFDGKVEHIHPAEEENSTEKTVDDIVEELKEDNNQIISEPTNENLESTVSVDDLSNDSLDETDSIIQSINEKSSTLDENFTNDTKEFSASESITPDEHIDESDNSDIKSDEISIDDIFEDEKDVDESKDLFSVLFGDE